MGCGKSPTALSSNKRYTEIVNTISGLFAPGPRAAHRPVVTWLLVVFGMVGAMVVVGGITRLTGSGLSMVEWHPLMGILPPLSESAWLETFAQYQTSPQYQQVNQWMTLADFQRIFFWEYLHRLSGRTIGLVFFVPFVWFAVRKRITGRLLRRCAVAFFLGGAQGLLGWFMVKSGLVDVPEVSHFRLAAHLGLAFFVGMYVLWIVADLVLEGARPTERRAPRWLSFTVLASLGLQIVYGAFMAGKKAGLLFQTFPDMNGSYFPETAFYMSSWSANVLDNPVFIHAFHRTLAWGVGALVVAFALAILRTRPAPVLRRTAWLMIALVALQILLGVLTVVYAVPVTMAVLHQAGAFLLLAACVVATYLVSPRRAG